MSYKRLLFVAVTAVLTLSLALMTFLTKGQQLLVIALLTLLAYAASAFAQRDGLKGIKYLTLLVLPTATVTGFGLTLYFFPNLSPIFKSGLLLLHFGLFYAVLLSENIFNVTTDRPIPLYRAAHTISFLSTISVVFLLFTGIYKMEIHAAFQAILVAIVAGFTAFQLLWTVDLKHNLVKELAISSILVGIGVSELALGLSVLPMKAFFRAVALSTGFYIGLGIGQQYFRHSLSVRAVYEFGITALIVAFVIASL